jgi:hypothetical protein
MRLQNFNFFPRKIQKHELQVLLEHKNVKAKITKRYTANSNASVEVLWTLLTSVSSRQ